MMSNMVCLLKFQGVAVAQVLQMQVPVRVEAQVLQMQVPVRV
jgi:hypothetical protein